MPKTTALENDFSKMNDGGLIALAQKGCNRSFDELTQRHRPRMYRLALRIVRDPDDAEDVTQQAFVSAYLNLDRFRGDSAFTTWMTRITTNEGLSLLRKRKGRFVELFEQTAEGSEDALPVLTHSSESPEDLLLRAESGRLLRRSLESVKAVYRQAMELRLNEDLSLEEISGRLSMPVNTVKVHLFRGRQTMKSYLESYGERVA